MGGGGRNVRRVGGFAKGGFAPKDEKLVGEGGPVGGRRWRRVRVLESATKEGRQGGTIGVRRSLGAKVFVVRSG